MTNFKWMKTFAKIMTYSLIGGAIAFAICAVSLWFNAMGIAKDISRNYLMQVCADGCSNYETRSDYYEGIIETYTSKYICIPGSKEDPDSSSYTDFEEYEVGVNSPSDENVAVYDSIEHKKRFIPDNTDDDSIKCLTAISNGTRLDNHEGNDYGTVVQRGTPITVTAKVYLRFFLPFKLGVGTGESNTYYDLDGSGSSTSNDTPLTDSDFKINFVDGKYLFSVEASTTGISTRYFKAL